MKKDTISQALSGIDEKYVEEASYQYRDNKMQGLYYQHEINQLTRSPLSVWLFNRISRIFIYLEIFFFIFKCSKNDKFYLLAFCFLLVASLIRFWGLICNHHASHLVIFYKNDIEANEIAHRLWKYYELLRKMSLVFLIISWLLLLIGI